MSDLKIFRNLKSTSNFLKMVFEILGAKALYLYLEPVVMFAMLNLFVTKVWSYIIVEEPSDMVVVVPTWSLT